jgi:hypothetical protein
MQRHKDEKRKETCLDRKTETLHTETCLCLLQTSYCTCQRPDTRVRYAPQIHASDSRVSAVSRRHLTHRRVSTERQRHLTHRRVSTERQRHLTQRRVSTERQRHLTQRRVSVFSKCLCGRDQIHASDASLTVALASLILPWHCAFRSLPQSLPHDWLPEGRCIALPLSPNPVLIITNLGCHVIIRRSRFDAANRCDLFGNIIASNYFVACICSSRRAAALKQ